MRKLIMWFFTAKDLDKQILSDTKTRVFNIIKKGD